MRHAGEDQPLALSGAAQRQPLALSGAVQRQTPAFKQRRNTGLWLTWPYRWLRRKMGARTLFLVKFAFVVCAVITGVFLLFSTRLQMLSPPRAPGKVVPKPTMRPGWGSPQALVVDPPPVFVPTQALPPLQVLEPHNQGRPVYGPEVEPRPVYGPQPFTETT